MNIPSTRLPAICQAYGCSVSEVFVDEGEQGPDAIIRTIPIERRALARRVAVKALSEFLKEGS
jgi:hypothetical protein